MSLTLDIARRALDASRARAREFNCQVSIALVDSAGHLVAFERMMSPYAWATSGIAIAKATSAVMFNQSTADIARWAGDIPGFASSMASMTQGKFIMAPGGWPIRGAGGVTIGAIGISGGNAPGRDDDIARAGVLAAESALQAYYQQRAQAQAQAQQPAPAQQPAIPAAPSPMSSGVQQSVQLPQAAPSTVELAHQEPGASVYTPLTLNEESGNTVPAPASGSDPDDQPTMTATRETPE
ncbi:MAG TPA: heme-binding protein [Ktedonobacterales bacterium]|jgi:uncharacterized protein GlcG (DUF336 family)